MTFKPCNLHAWTPDDGVPPPNPHSFVQWAKGRIIRRTGFTGGAQEYCKFNIKIEIQLGVSVMIYNIYKDGKIEQALGLRWDTPDWEDVSDRISKVSGKAICDFMNKEPKNPVLNPWEPDGETPAPSLEAFLNWAVGRIIVRGVGFACLFNIKPDTEAPSGFRCHVYYNGSINESIGFDYDYVDWVDVTTTCPASTNDRIYAYMKEQCAPKTPELDAKEKRKIKKAIDTNIEQKPRYGGKKSKKFWKKINALPDPQHDTAYSLGVILQNIEGDILRLIQIEIDDAKELSEPMETDVQAQPRMTLDQFANEHNLKMVITERGQETPAAFRWYAQFDNSNIIDGCMLRSSCGDGATKEEAIKNYGPKISEKEIVIGAYSDDRREIRVPIIVSAD